MIQAIESFKEIKLPEKQNAYILLDVDQTLINPDCYIANPEFKYRKIFDILKKFNKSGMIEDDYTQNILAEFRSKRPEKLIEDGWPQFIQKAQELGHQLLALTCLPTGKFIGLEITIEEWRYQILKNLKINFNEEEKSLKLSEEKDNYICLHHGIIQTGKYNKADSLKAYLKQSNKKPEIIYFVDDKIEYLQEVENLLESEDIEFSGYLYQGLKHFKYSDFSPSKAEKQLEILLNFAQFIHDREIDSYKNSGNAQLIDPNLYKMLLSESKKIFKLN